MVKAACRRFCERAQLTAAQTATVSNGVGGAVASLATQSVIVPIDVVRMGYTVLSFETVRCDVVGWSECRGLAHLGD